MILVKENLERYVAAAKAAGCPRDQVARFVEAQYVAQPKQLEFHALARECDRDDGPFWVGVGGARGGSKSHMIMAQMGLDDCQRVPGLKLLFLRQIQKSAAESLEDLTFRVFGAIEHKFTRSPGQVTFPKNDSRIILGGYRNESDIGKYLGIEYDGIGLEEATQLSESKITKLRGSVRSSKLGWRERVYTSTNPGGIGHPWYKEHFVVPQRKGELHHNFIGGQTRFIPATYRDNAFVSQSYIDYLEALTGPLGEAWREGNWDIFEGMAFPQWNEERHVIAPRAIPFHWPKWRAIDWGYAAPWACYWMTKNPDNGRIYVYREAYYTELDDRQQPRMIQDMTPPAEKVDFTYADPSMWARKNLEGKVSSTADEYLKERVILTRADNDRIGGKRKVDRVLAPLPDGLPGLQIFDTCPHLIRTLPALPYDPNRKEDVDTKAEDHAYDALRYGLSNVDAMIEIPRDNTVARMALEDYSLRDVL